MNIKQKYEQAQQNADLFRDALRRSINNEVIWDKSAMVNTLWESTINPKQHIRVGVADSAEPLVIVNFIELNEVVVMNPWQIAKQWSWPAVEAFPELAGLIRRHVDLGDQPHLTHVPSWTWIKVEILETFLPNLEKAK